MYGKVDTLSQHNHVMLIKGQAKKCWQMKSSTAGPIILLLSLTALLPVSAAATSPVLGAPRIPLTMGNSLNWAGYADVVEHGTVTAANGSFVVPTLTCSNKQAYVALWVGIDGYNDSTVEQTGVLGQCSHGAASYSAWYEFYPTSPVYSSNAVKAGDVINASVTYNNGAFTTTIYDKSQGWTYTSPPTVVSGARRSSAEWITERPAIGNHLTTLADFGTASYGYDYTGLSGTNFATIGGTTGQISSFNNAAITMVSGGHRSSTLASPSLLSTDGTSSFYVAYG